MREDIALARQLNPKHRPRQHLRHRSLRHDLLFFRHEAIIAKKGGVLNSVGPLENPGDFQKNEQPDHRADGMPDQRDQTPESERDHVRRLRPWSVPHRSDV